jgi:hypothetical protein
MRSGVTQWDPRRPEEGIDLATRLSARIGDRKTLQRTSGFAD